MALKMKYITSTTIIILFLLLACSEKGKEQAAADNLKAPVKWEKISTALQTAEQQKKPVLMFFYTEWCIYCTKMDKEIFSSPEISEYINENFISLRINPEKDTETLEIMGQKIHPSQLMSYTGSKGFPTILFLDSRKKPVTTIPGYVEKKTFLPILKYLKEECYESKISLDSYIQNPELCRAKKS